MTAMGWQGAAGCGIAASSGEVTGGDRQALQAWHEHRAVGLCSVQLGCAYGRKEGGVEVSDLPQRQRLQLCLPLEQAPTGVRAGCTGVVMLPKQQEVCLLATHNPACAHAERWGQQT